MNTEEILPQLYDFILGWAPTIVKAIVTLIIGFWIIKKLVVLAERLMKSRDLDISLTKFLSSLLGIALKVMLLFSVIGMFGISTTSFLAIFSALMVGIGMALNGSLGHLASGVMLMIFKPFKVGDLVDLNGNVGTVDAINAFNTTLATLDNKRIILGNTTVTSNTITNISGQGTVGVDMTFGIGYGDDIDKARSVIQSVIDRCPNILKEPSALIKVSQLNDSSVDFLIRPWCKSEHYWDVFFFMNEEVKKAFDKEGVGIPFPTIEMVTQSN